MDSLPEDEIEAIWQRVKAKIDTKKVKSISKKMIAEEIENELRSAESGPNTQATGNFLIQHKFADNAVANKKILDSLISDRIVSIQVRGITRFQIKKGSTSLEIAPKKFIRAGQFLSGKTKDEAIASLEKKAESKPKKKAKKSG